ncbi:M3 family oligoendopeptidase [Marinimicrococcus flavescens]|uniref:M3 family oligoendopeptidase n=1 Tax=Marinimicrococcus flavescens TaxID=3031815 RepID=A0AAP3XR82_9PROT|nr:M3 family oligoendopeptidase [Marinimicrococcus flavescens]
MSGSTAAGAARHPAGGDEAGLPAWNLDDLFAGREDPRIAEFLAEADAMAEKLAADAKGRFAELSGDGLADVIARYETLEEKLGRVASFASLMHAADREDAEIGRFFQSIQEQITTIGTKVLFVTLELNKLEDGLLERRIAESAGLARYRPWLRTVRSFRPHQLDDEIERVLHEKSVTGRSAWVRLFDETMAGLRFPLEGRDLSAQEIFDLLSAKDRGKREAAAASIAEVLKKNIRLFARITNTLAKDKQIEDGWRSFERPISGRNLANQVEDEVVAALIDAVQDAYPRLSHRYYALKARWLGLEKLEYWDRNAPLPEDADQRRPWDEAQRLVLDAYGRFSPELASILGDFFERRWIDAAPRAGKDSGAFCHPTVPSVHPYVLMNYQGKSRDVMTLAHELGHGVHQVLAGQQGYLMASTPLTLAETASVFGEQLTFEALLEAESDPVRRRVLLASKIEDKINTVVRQIAFCEFERRVHDRRREGELTPSDLGEIWMAVQQESLGPAFVWREEYRTFWSYVPHFVHVPFYVYAYAFGDCLVSSLYAVYRQQPDGFQTKYLEMLKAGGTLRHKELLAPFGLDAGDPGFWAKGLGLLEELIDQLEAELDQAGIAAGAPAGEAAR